MGERDLVLSALRIEPVDAVFPASILRYDPQTFEELRARSDLFAFRRTHEPVSRQLIVMPYDRENRDLPRPTSHPCAYNLSVLAELITHRLPSVVPQLKLTASTSGIDQIDESEDLFRLPFERADLTFPEDLARLHVHRRVRLRVRHEQVPTYGTILLLTMDVRRAFSIDGTVADLLAAGLDLRGLTIRRVGDDDPRSAVTVRSIDNGKLQLQAARGPTGDPGSYVLDASPAAFDALVEQRIGRASIGRYKATDFELQSEVLSGERYLSPLRSLARAFEELSPQSFARGFSVRFGPLITLPVRAEPAITQLPPPLCSFGAGTGANPAEDLASLGPLDMATMAKKKPFIAFAFPSEARDDIERFASSFLHGIAGTRFEKGFTAAFRLRGAATQLISVDLEGASSSQVTARYLSSLDDQIDWDRKPDLVIVMLRDEDAFAKADNHPYLAIKALLLGAGVPSLHMRLTKARAKQERLLEVLQDLALAAYGSLGGVPWTLATPAGEELVIGLGTVVDRSPEGSGYRSVVAVFSAQGALLAATYSAHCTHDDYARTLVDTVARGLKTVLDTTHVPLTRLVFHMTKAIPKRATDELARAAMGGFGLGLKTETALLMLQLDHPLRLVDTRAQEPMSRMIPPRGIALELGRAKRFLTVHGEESIRSEEGIPPPLFIEIHTASTYSDVPALTQQVYDFTSAYHASMMPLNQPVTTYYAKVMARMIARLEMHPAWSEDLLVPHLRSVHWFL